MNTATAKHTTDCRTYAEMLARENLSDMGELPADDFGVIADALVSAEARRYLADGTVECSCNA
jgi:hypothetical protein